MNKILLATDFSFYTPQLLYYSLYFAKKNKASLTLVNVVPASSVKKEVNNIGNQRMALMKEAVNDSYMKELTGVEIHYIVEENSNSSGIMKVAREEKMDLIVMGIKGKRNGPKPYVGSVTLEVIENSEIPILLIPAKSVNKPIDNIALAFDLHLEDILGLNKVSPIIHGLKAKVKWINIVDKSENLEAIDEKMDQVATLLRHNPKYKELYFFSYKGDFEDKIAQFISNQKIDLLVTYARRRFRLFKFFKNLNAAIATDVKVPMIIVKQDTKKLE